MFFFVFAIFWEGFFWLSHKLLERRDQEHFNLENEQIHLFLIPSTCGGLACHLFRMRNRSGSFFDLFAFSRTRSVDGVPRYVWLCVGRS